MEKGKKIKKNEGILVEEKIVLDKNEKRIVKFVSLLTSFFATGLAIIIFVFSVIASLSIANLPKDELINNNIVVTLLSKLNNYSIVDAKDLITSMSSRFTFIMFEVIVPTIAFIGAMLLLITLAKKLIDFVSDIKFEKDLFNNQKVQDAQDIISLLSLALLTTLVLFNEPSIIFYLLIVSLLCIIFILFKKCVSLNKR